MKLTNIKDMDEYCRLTDTYIVIEQAHHNDCNTPIVKGKLRGQGYCTKHPKYS